MRRSQSVRKAVYALVVLAIFMVVLRISRPTNMNGSNSVASQAGAHHNAEPGSGKADAPAVEQQQLQQKEEVKPNAAAAASPAKPTKQKPSGIDTRHDTEAYNVTEAYDNILHSQISPPVIIFSKSRCPHSARAKSLLLDAYTIEPKPMVIELDIIPNGVELQRYIGEVTKRHTVPNILVNGISRGGASEMSELGDEIITKFLEWGEGKISINKKMPDAQF